MVKSMNFMRISPWIMGKLWGNYLRNTGNMWTKTVIWPWTMMMSSWFINKKCGRHGDEHIKTLWCTIYSTHVGKVWKSCDFSSETVGIQQQQSDKNNWNRSTHINTNVGNFTQLTPETGESTLHNHRYKWPAKPMYLAPFSTQTRMHCSICR